MKKLLLAASLCMALAASTCGTDAVLDQAKESAGLCAQAAVLGADFRPIASVEDIVRREALLICANELRERSNLPLIPREAVGLPPLDVAATP